MFMRKAVITAVMVAVSAVALQAGPPWISIEYPSNPHHPSTRDASLMIRTYHHTQSITSKIDAAAVGIVSGKRTSMSLHVRDTSMPGVYALRTPLPKGGIWVLSFTMHEQQALASAIVTVNRLGEVVAVKVPSTTSKDGWVIPRAATRADIDAALQLGVMTDAGAVKRTIAQGKPPR